MDLVRVALLDTDEGGTGGGGIGGGGGTGCIVVVVGGGGGGGRGRWGLDGCPPLNKPRCLSLSVDTCRKIAPKPLDPEPSG